LLVLLKFCDYEEKISNHKAAAARYTSLANNARIQLNLERTDREDPKQYMIWYTTSYGNLFESSPMLPDYVMLKWKLHANKHGFKIPGEVGILMDVDESESMKQELTELKKELTRKNTQIESMEMSTSVMKDIAADRKKQCNKRVRLSMYNLGAQHHTDFNANDLARFNNILMKKEINHHESQISSRQSSQPNTTRTDNHDDHHVDDHHVDDHHVDDHHVDDHHVDDHHVDSMV